jgi:hypothetical protein
MPDAAGLSSMQTKQMASVATRASKLAIRLKRRFLRTPTYIEATIRPLVMNAPVDCVIRDISDAGAKLRVSHAAVPVGSLFDLDIPSRGERRRCHLVWRDRDTLGVEFVSRR